MLAGIQVEGGDVRVDVLLTIEGCPLRDRITQDVTAAVQPLPGVERVAVSLTPMSAEQREALVGKLRPNAAGPTKIRFSDKTSIIAVASGKGGVGKSSVTVNLARRWRPTATRSACSTPTSGDSACLACSARKGQPVGFNDMILPLEAHGVKVISMGFFVPEDTPVIWRGPMFHKAIEQFLGDVYWGDLDLLLCDLPPGTGDVSISLASFLPGASMLVVTTPQEAAHTVASVPARWPSARTCGRSA